MTALPEIQSEFDVWNVSPVYWVRVDDWALVGGWDRELCLYKIALNQYPASGPTYRMAMIGLERPASSAPLEHIAAQLAHAHGIEAPAWLAPSLIGIVRLLAAHEERPRAA